MGKKIKQRILITGGAGFIGSHLCEAFLAQGASVVCVDNLITGARTNIGSFLKEKKFVFLKQDICVPKKIAGPVDAVLHFASLASPPDYLKHSLRTLRVGSTGTENALEVAREKKARFLLASTSEVYGDPLVHPQKESYFGHVNPIGPRSVYDESKRYAEALTMAYHRFYGLNTKIIRIFNTYGERMRPEDGRVIPNFISQSLRQKPLTVYGDGSQTRSYCYIDDLIAGILRALDSDLHTPVNLGNPNEMSVLNLAKVILKATGSKSPLIYKPLPVDDPKQRKPDISLAREALGWQPNIPLEQGLEKTIAYFRTLLCR